MSRYRPRSLTEYFRLISARKSMLLLAAGSMFAATLWIVRSIPDTYQSKATIVITDGSEGRELASGRVAAAVERLSSAEFLTPIMDRYHLYGDAVRKGKSDAGLARMRKDINVQTQYRGDFPESVVLSYRNPNAAVAKSVADELVSVFAGMNQAIDDQMKKDIDATNSSLSDIEGRLQVIASAKAADESRRATAYRAESRMSAIRAQQLADSKSAEELSNKQFELDQKVAEQQKEIEAQAKLVKTAPATADKGSSFGSLLVKKAELEGQEQLYSTEYTDKNPKVIETKAQLAALDQEIQKFRSQGTDPDLDSAEGRDLRAMQRELAQMEIERSVNQRALDIKRKQTGNAAASFSDMAAVPGSAFSEGESPAAEGLKARFGALLNRQDAFSKQQIDSAGLAPGIFQIVDQPVKASSASGPDRLRLVLLGLGISLTFGFIIVAAIEAPNLSAISSVSDVDYYLGAPVIALIPETLTPAERGRMRRIRLLRSTGTLLLAIALIPLFVAAFNYLQIFQIVANH